MDENAEVDAMINQLAEKYGSQLGSFPELPNKDTLLAFMRDVIKEEDDLKQLKEGNLRDPEVGMPKIPVLNYVHIGQYADSEELTDVGAYLRKKAGLVAVTSLGRRAKLLDTLFTVRRETKNFGTPKTTVKRGMFGGDTTIKEGVEQ